MHRRPARSPFFSASPPLRISRARLFAFRRTAIGARLDSRGHETRRRVALRSVSRVLHTARNLKPLRRTLELLFARVERIEHYRRATLVA